MRRNYSTPFVYIMLVCGIITLLFGSWQLYRVVKVKNFGTYTEGTIVDYYSKRKSPQALFGTHLVYSPGFSFVDKNRVKYTLRSPVYETDKRYEIGDRVTILYDSKNPANAYIADKLPWKSGAAILAVAVVAILFGVIQLRNRF